MRPRLPPSAILRSYHPRSIPRLPPAYAARPFTTTRPRQDAPRSPFATFVETLKSEYQKSTELQDSVKSLSGQADKVADSETLKRAKEMYERARLTRIMEENPRLRKMAEDLKKTGGSVTDAVGTALRQIDESRLMQSSREAYARASQAVADATEPIRSTEAYKQVAQQVSDAIDEAGGNVRYGGYIEKEERRRRRTRRLEKAGRIGGLNVRSRQVVEENPDAGQAVVLSAHQATAEEPRVSRLRSALPIPMQRWLTSVGTAYEESENPFVESMRSVTSFFGRAFDETEQARVVRAMKALDPTFEMERFLKELREYMVPEIVDAISSADTQALREWCSDAPYNIMTAETTTYAQRGLMNDCKVLDINSVDIHVAKFLETDETVPVIAVAWRTQEIFVWREAKSKEVALGAADKIEQYVYVGVLTRTAEELDNEVTGGWKFIEMARRPIGR